MADYVWAQTATILGAPRTAGTDADEVEALPSRQIQRLLDRGYISVKQEPEAPDLSGYQQSATAATDAELASGLAGKQDAATAATDAELAAALAGVTSGVDHRRKIIGQPVWFGPIGFGTAYSFALGQNFYIPLMPLSDVVVSHIELKITAANPTASGRAALYSSKANGTPDARLHALPSAIVPAVGVSAWPIGSNLTLSKGVLYWAAFLYTGSGANPSAAGAYGDAQEVPMPTAYKNITGCYSVRVNESSALPDTCTLADFSTVTQIGQAPFVGLRVAA